MSVSSAGGGSPLLQPSTTVAGFGGGGSSTSNYPTPIAVPSSLSSTSPRFVPRSKRNAAAASTGTTSEVGMWRARSVAMQATVDEKTRLLESLRTTTSQPARNDFQHAKDKAESTNSWLHQLHVAIDGCLTLLGPERTAHMIGLVQRVLGNVSELSSRCEAVAMAKDGELRAVEDLLKSTTDLASCLRSRAEAGEQEFRKFSATAEKQEAMVSNARTYVKVIMAERLAWQEQCGANPAKLPVIHPTFVDRCQTTLRLFQDAEQVNKLPSVLTLESANQVLHRFQSRTNDHLNQGSVLLRYVPPSEELALLDAALKTSGSDVALHKELADRERRFDRARDEVFVQCQTALLSLVEVREGLAQMRESLQSLRRDDTMAQIAARIVNAVSLASNGAPGGGLYVSTSVGTAHPLQSPGLHSLSLGQSLMYSNNNPLMMQESSILERSVSEARSTSHEPQQQRRRTTMMAAARKSISSPRAALGNRIGGGGGGGSSSNADAGELTLSQTMTVSPSHHANSSNGRTSRIFSSSVNMVMAMNSLRSPRKSQHGAIVSPMASSGVGKNFTTTDSPQHTHRQSSVTPNFSLQESGSVAFSNDRFTSNKSKTTFGGNNSDQQPLAVSPSSSLNPFRSASVVQQQQQQTAAASATMFERSITNSIGGDAPFRSPHSEPLDAPLLYSSGEPTTRSMVVRPELVTHSLDWTVDDKRFSVSDVGTSSDNSNSAAAGRDARVGSVFVVAPIDTSRYMSGAGGENRSLSLGAATGGNNNASSSSSYGGSGDQSRMASVVAMSASLTQPPSNLFQAQQQRGARESKVRFDLIAEGSASARPLGCEPSPTAADGGGGMNSNRSPRGLTPRGGGVLTFIAPELPPSAAAATTAAYYGGGDDGSAATTTVAVHARTMELSRPEKTTENIHHSQRAPYSRKHASGGGGGGAAPAPSWDVNNPETVDESDDPTQHRGGVKKRSISKPIEYLFDSIAQPNFQVDVTLSHYGVARQFRKQSDIDGKVAKALRLTEKLELDAEAISSNAANVAKQVAALATAAELSGSPTTRRSVTMLIASGGSGNSGGGSGPDGVVQLVKKYNEFSQRVPRERVSSAGIGTAQSKMSELEDQRTSQGSLPCVLPVPPSARPSSTRQASRTSLGPLQQLQVMSSARVTSANRNELKKTLSLTDAPS